jgi:hypothetical protein
MFAREAWTRRVAILLLAAAFGCGDSEYFTYGVPSVLKMDVPPPRKPIIGDFGVDLSIGWTGDSIWETPVAGVAWFPDGHHEHIWGVYAGVDPVWGHHKRTARYPADARPFVPILRPVLGMWFWVESPNNAGFMTGIKAGIGKVMHSGDANAVVGIEYQTFFLYDFLGDKGASIQNAALTLTWSY